MSIFTMARNMVIPRFSEEEKEFFIKYEVVGRYFPQTFNLPEEYPELAVLSVGDADGDYDLFLLSQAEDIMLWEECWDDFIRKNPGWMNGGHYFE